MRAWFIILLGLLATGCGRSSQAHPERVRPHAAAPGLDSDQDGLPDAAELTSFSDRENFRRWFAGIAGAQFEQVSEAWNPGQRDCAGLVRFALREALRRHDRAWLKAMGPGYEALAPDVRAYSLGRGPLGEKLFRTDFGSYRETDLEAGKFSEFADARTLKNYNCVLLGRDRRQARPGDLLFFHQPWVQKYPYHVMVFLGAADSVVYHTGSSPTDEGVVKKVSLAALDGHPDARWRPVAHNPHFLGFYRLKILD